MNTSEGKAVERPVKNQSENPVKLLHVERLSKSFSGFNALCDVSFDLREQDVPGIIGHMESEKPQCWNVLRDSCQSIAERSAGTTSSSRLAGEKM
jgi:ABC-type branched-subunit amino acid transport system ATPase component